MNRNRRLILAISLVIVLTSGCVTDVYTISKIPKIGSGEMPNYIGYKVGINLTPISILNKSTYNYYYREPVFWSVRKKSIYDEYKVYDTTDKVKIATYKNTRLASEKDIIVVGTIKEDEYQSGNLIIFADEIIEVKGLSGEI